MSRGQDLVGLLKGAQMVAEALAKERSSYARHLWANSNFRQLLGSSAEELQKRAEKVLKEPGKELESFGGVVKEALDRSTVVTQGIKQFVAATPLGKSDTTTAQSEDTSRSSGGSGAVSGDQKIDLSDLDVSSVTLRELEEILSEVKQKKVRLRFDDKKRKEREREKKESQQETPLTKEVKFTPPIAPVLQPQQQVETKDVKHVKGIIDLVATYKRDDTDPSPPPVDESQSDGKIILPHLSEVAKQRKVPSSRIGRVISFGNLFAGIGFGTVTELAKGSLGLGGAKTVKEAALSPDNIERIVDTLCRVRGAALKIGQILSIQDSNVVSPQLVKAFDRVRQAADYMPDWQVEKVLCAELGNDWRDNLASFESKPFAAASIGQVHRAQLPDGTEIALKIQYPGVAKSIESDIDNLVSMLKVWDIFPPGMFIDNIVKVAKRELSWEVDYLREADYTERFAEMIAQHTEFKVPKVYKELTTSSVLATELAPGIPVDQCVHLSEEHRLRICRAVMKLCLLELFQYRCMQTDPNWANFLYDEKSQKITLIDFGATRFYPKQFMDDYLKVSQDIQCSLVLVNFYFNLLQVIMAAAKNDRKTVQEYSIKMGFLTGYETAAMLNAHVDAVMILGEVFSVPGDFDFGSQDTTRRIAQLVPVMVAHRLCPPPDEIYSLHRKLSGVFLLCAKLRTKFDVKPDFDAIVKDYKWDESTA